MYSPKVLSPVQKRYSTPIRPECRWLTARAKTLPEVASATCQNVEDFFWKKPVDGVPVLQWKDALITERLFYLVPKKGLEPSHPCEYMDLNHARLPIPPRWQSTAMSGALPATCQEEKQHLFYR